MMKIISFLLVILAVSSAETEERGLQRLRDRIGNRQGVCDRMSDGIRNSNMYCECAIAPLRLQASLYCSGDEQRCSRNDRVCTNPSVFTAFSLWSLGKFSVEFCFEGVTYGNLPFPTSEEPEDMCLDFEMSTTQVLCGGSSVISCIGPIVGALTGGAADDAGLETTDCTAKYKGKTCGSCTLCDDTGDDGDIMATWDCTDVGGAVQTECMGLKAGAWAP